jgi:amino acid adenylation domain-containing protein
MAILGASKAGKIYVPLDPLYPPTRLIPIVEDSQAGLIVTDNQNLSLANELTQGPLQLLNLDKIDSMLSSENLSLPLPAKDLAYVMYTSGSTGQPKGVVETHRNVLHDVMCYTNNLHLCREDRLTLLHSISFRASELNLFGSLLNGASLLIFGVKRGEVSQLIRWLFQEEISIYHSVPSLFRNMMDSLAGQEKFSKTRLVHLSGAPVIKRDVDLYQRHFPPQCIFLHRIGTTETQTVSWNFIDKSTQIVGSIVPLGWPVEDKRILLLDGRGNEVKAGQVGEIAVKTQYLSPGYWHKPEVTQDKFLADPGGAEERIYLTGDLGRMAPDGCLFHLGRKDFQVKIRGYRVEVAEIEATLTKHMAIKEAVVVARQDQPNEIRLVGYFVPASEPIPTVSKLRRFLTEKLPEHMIPSAFVILDAMPLTPNGKVDRRALPAPDWARPELDEIYVAPRTAVEEELAGIWADVLALDQVGVYDNFFELGGNSILATQVISRVFQTLQVELPMRSFFEEPTVAGAAKIIETVHSITRAARDSIEGDEQREQGEL